MRNSKYSFQMERSENIYLHVDTAQSGVGGINSWKTPPLEKHRLNEEVYTYAYRLIPFSGSVEAALTRRASFNASDVAELAKPDVSRLPEIKAPKGRKKKKK
jgi:hypothetical protein